MAKKAIFINEAGYVTTIYTCNSPATCTVGGITAGTVLTGQTMQYLMQEILAPYIEPAFSSFNVSVTPQPFEVGTSMTGNKDFTFGASTSANITSGSIGICEVGGALLASGCDYADSPISADIGTLSNSTPDTWTWRVTGCSTQDTEFGRNVSKCSIYPYYWGVETSGTRPTANNDLITGGTKCVSIASNCVSIDFNNVGQWTWFAMPSICTSRTKWISGAAPNCGDIAVAPTDKYPDEQAVSVTSSDGCWSSISYKVYVSGSASTDGLPIQFRTY